MVWSNGHQTVRISEPGAKNLRDLAILNDADADSGGCVHVYEGLGSTIE